jgi:uncharacterized protein
MHPENAHLREDNSHHKTSKFVKLSIESEADLYDRALRNAERLEADPYIPETMYERMKTDGWPGDTEGRLLLGQVLLASALNREPQTLNDLLALWPEYLNEKGYFGPDHEGRFSEQQLSSHGWVLRGLCELHLWRRDEWSLEQIRNIVDTLALPCLGEYKNYPVTGDQDQISGDVSGHSVDSSGKWILSTDTGCAFIFMDGVIQAYTILGGEKLKMLCEEMIERFLQVDVVNLGLQTHATLTGTRGVLRFQQCHPEREDLLQAARDIFQTYLDHGMTETWGNHNWFGRPGWTEPCAIIDSLQIARQLWEATGLASYRDIWQLIRWNGLVHGQRANGGFGTDSCAGSLPSEVYQKNGSGKMLRLHGIEATQCCSMRGAEGLADALLHQAIHKNDAIYLPLMEACTVTDPKGNVLVVESSYPWEGSWRLERKGDACCVYLAAPEWCDDWQIDGQPVEPIDGWIECSLVDDQCLSVTSKISIVRKGTVGHLNIQNLSAWRHGPAILGLKRAQLTDADVAPIRVGRKAFEFAGEAMVPLSERWNLPMPNNEEAKNDFAAYAQQILFATEKNTLS